MRTGKNSTRKEKLSSITDEKISHYLDLTKRAIEKVKLADKKPVLWKAAEFLDMARRYYSDAVYFLEKGDIVNAFAAVNYAHGWLDAGARIGFFDVNDTTLFAIDAINADEKKSSTKQLK